MAEDDLITGAAEVATDILAKGPNVPLIAGGALVLGIAVGATAGYFFAKKQLETKYSQLADEEIEKMRDHFTAREIARREKPDLEDVAAAGKVDKVLKAEGYSQADAEEPASIVISKQDSRGDVVAIQPTGETPDKPVKTHYETRNVWDNQPDPSELDPDTWDYHKETKWRMANLGIPFVINKDELGEEGDFDCLTWTYYEKDDTLTDERDEVVDDRDAYVWGQNLLRFGDGSGDPNIVYVRNIQYELEYEIVRSDQSYAQSLGFDDEEDALRHHDIPVRRRWDDDE